MPRDKDSDNGVAEVNKHLSTHETTNRTLHNQIPTPDPKGLT